MYGYIGHTPYDLRFSVLGIPVRVHPVFWLTSFLLAWYPHRLDLIVARMLAIFAAILVHELGHAIITRAFGWRPEIVLYFFGGYATTRRHSTWKDIAVLAAGPGAGFLLFLLCLALRPAVHGGGSEVLGEALRFSLFINLVWNIMNLLPVLPLDGGQITRELLDRYRPRRSRELSVRVSTVSAGVVAAAALIRLVQDRDFLGLDPLFLAVMFGYLCYQGARDPAAWGGGYR